MTTVTLAGNPIDLSGDLPKTGRYSRAIVRIMGPQQERWPRRAIRAVWLGSRT